jgi:hypothetical protein
VDVSHISKRKLFIQGRNIDTRVRVKKWKTRKTNEEKKLRESSGKEMFKG